MLHKALGGGTAWLAALLLITVACAPGTAAPAAPAPTATATVAAQRAAQGLAANLVTGVLREVSGSSLTLQGQGGAVNATLAPNATVLKQSLISLADLRVGEQVTFVGLRDSSGAMLASVVRVVPQSLGDLAAGLFAGPLDAAGGQVVPRVGAGAGGFGQGQGGQGQRPGAARTPGELTIAGPVESVQGDAVVVTSASVTYTVRLAENGQVIRIATVPTSELQPGMRITGRGEQTNGAWTLTFLLLVDEPRGPGRVP